MKGFVELKHQAFPTMKETRGKQGVVHALANPPSLLLTAPPRSPSNPCAPYPNHPATSPSQQQTTARRHVFFSPTHLNPHPRNDIIWDGDVRRQKAFPRNANPPAWFVAGSNQESDDECCVCLNAPRRFAFVPCGHRCACETCTQNTTKECPCCRAVATTAIKIFC